MKLQVLVSFGIRKTETAEFFRGGFKGKMAMRSFLRNCLGFMFLVAGMESGCRAFNRPECEMSSWSLPFVVASTDECARYERLHPRFGKAFEFLKRPDLAMLPVGRYEIETNNCWAIVQELELTPFGDIQHPEVHRDFIDIQAPLDGPETYGLYDTKGTLFEPFDAAKDIGFADAKTEPLTLRPGEFAIFFPDSGAHAPCKTLGPTTMRKKLVIKVRK